MTLVPGQELTHYRLLEQIGEGGMGVVWKAMDTTLGREVAIKVLPEVFARDPERMARFEREARLLASLNHPHIASIYGVGSALGVRFLAMELVLGDDLATRVAHGPLPVAEAVDLARQVAEALEAAHERGIVHRDLKPANVKLTADGQVKVLDFGLAKALEGETASASGAQLSHSPTLTGPMTAANVILGTAAYMSPEQARGRAVDRRADIWAFGCVLYECLTGRRAFSGETVSDTLAKILEREPDLDALPGSTPPRVRELLQRCLAKDAKLRLRDIGDARILLDEVYAARSPSGRLLVAEEPGKRGTRRGSPLALALVGLVGLGLGAGLWNLLAPHKGGDLETRCVTVPMPSDVSVEIASLTRDGSTLLVDGRPKSADGSETSEPRLYARRLDRYEFKELAGTEGLRGFGWLKDDRTLVFNCPVSPGAPQLRLARMPLDGSAPPTTIGEWKDSWRGATQLQSGDLLIQEGPASFVRLSLAGGAPSAPVKIDAGRPGVSNYQIRREGLPEDRGALVDVISYDSHGWHYSVGVMDPKSGKVKVVEEEGGNAVYTPGYLIFSRGDAVLAAPFDLGRLEARGAPVAVWNGLNSPFAVSPGNFQLTRNGALFYRPGQAGGARSLAFLDLAGKLAPWSAEQWALDAPPEPSPDGRRFACSIVNGRGIDELWVSDLARPGLQRLGTDPNADCVAPLWSPDGKRIAYRRQGKDTRDGVYIQDADGGEAERVLKPESEHVQYTALSWLPDGSALIVQRVDAGQFGLAMCPLSGGEADSTRLRPVLPSAFSRFNPRLSPDGRLLAFGSDESGKRQSYVVAFHSDGSTGRPVRVETSGSIAHLWSADGKYLFVEDESDRLMKVAVTIVPDLSISAPAEVCDFDKLGVAMWSVLPDGRLFVGLRNENEGEITHYNLVLNWTADLKRKMQAAH
jgi:eukaryotic-like serine/threonine-protein kinase